MQLYHHYFSLNSQKVRLALEEKRMDYISHSLNPLKGKDLDAELFHLNPNGKIPVFTNGNRIITETLEIIQYIDSVNEPLGMNDIDRERLEEWMQKVDEWNPKLFTLSHTPFKLRRYFSRFKRRVAIARMAENPDLASKYRSKLHNAYATEELLNNIDEINANEQQLINILDAADSLLASTQYLAGASFTMADVMLIPVLARLELLQLDKEFIHSRNQLSEYWARVKHRPSYHKVIGQYFSGFNRHKTFFTTAFTVGLRDFFRKY
eukprot:c28955_g1_i4 orf=168-962(-)